MPATLRPALNKIVFTLGAGLALYLTALSYLNLPCPGDASCLPVLLNRFALIFRIPASAYGALLWFGILFVKDDTKRGALLALFLLCATVFLSLQLFILKGFCLYCVVHALLVFAAFWLRHEKPSLWPLLFSFLLAATAAAATIRWTPPEKVPTAHASELAVQKFVHPWLGPVDEKSPVLVLKLDDPGTLRLLDALVSTDWIEPARGPAIYLVMTPANKTLSTIFVADILVHANKGSRAFLDAARELCLNRELAEKAPGNLARKWTDQQPEARKNRVSAVWILNDQNEKLSTYKLRSTVPLLLTEDGGRRTEFPLEAIFGK